jgi:hypothetical protein
MSQHPPAGKLPWSGLTFGLPGAKRVCQDGTVPGVGRDTRRRHGGSLLGTWRIRGVQLANSYPVPSGSLYNT